MNFLENKQIIYLKKTYISNEGKICLSPTKKKKNKNKCSSR